MASPAYRRIRTALLRLPNILHGYNLYVNPQKLKLIESVFRKYLPSAESFADLGGIWNVDGAYAVHACRQFSHVHGTLVDTDIPPELRNRLQRWNTLRVIHGDFARKEIAEEVGPVDIVFFFDVLLHQANPDWNDVLALYAPNTRCVVIFNQQFVTGEQSVRLTTLPLEVYAEMTSDYRMDFYRYVYEHRDEIHPVYKKPWGDIHNIAQWGITDRDLRLTMERLGFQEVYFRNHGSFVGLSTLENHAFVFVRPQVLPSDGSMRRPDSRTIQRPLPDL